MDLKSNDRPSRKTLIVYQEQKTPTDINVRFDCPNTEIQMAYKMKVGVKDRNRRCSQGKDRVLIFSLVWREEACMTDPIFKGILKDQMT